VGAQLLGLAVLGGVVAFHEAGHFSAAALLKIRVDEFALGFGPALVQKRFKPAEEGGVNYVVRALPLGGYVSFPRVAEDEEDPARKPPPRATRSSAAVVPARPAIDPADPSLFENKPFIQQAVVVCAGIVFNLILSWSCIFGGAAVVGLPPPQPVSITRVLPGTPAEAAGFQIGDKLISVNQRTVDDFSDPLRGALGSIRSAITSQTPFTATVERSGQPVALLVSPPAVSSVLGVQLAAEAAPSTARAPLPPLRAASRATQTLIEQVTGVSRSLLPALAGALGGGSEGAGLQGPLAISATAGRIAEKNPALLLDFAALISVSYWPLGCQMSRADWHGDKGKTNRLVVGPHGLWGVQGEWMTGCSIGEKKQACCSTLPH
jgi:membrane-associated protease RseP (regulator of RpoE activity)